jgi:hypothetical protein
MYGVFGKVLIINLNDFSYNSLDLPMDGWISESDKAK